MNLFNNSFDKIAAESQIQRFLVLVHLVEGSHYLKPNMNTCVQVQVHHETKTTRVRKATHAPYYNETFAFDFEQNFESFLDNVVTLTVMDTGGAFKFKKPLGVCQFDLGIVWDMPDHQVYHKWAKLTDPSNRMPFIKGYLRFDLHILGPGETLKIPTQQKRVDDGVEGNLLFGAPGRNLEAQAKYIVRVFTGKDFVSKSDIPLLKQGRRRKSSNTSTNVSIAVSFANNTLTTERKPYLSSYQSSSISWNDQFTFTELFPPTFQRVKIAVLFNKTVEYTFYICLREIANAVGLVKESIPVFGPTVVYTYSNENFYAGALRISVEAVPVSVSLLKLNVGTAEKSKTAALQEDKLWKEDEFLLFMSVYEMGMLPKHLGGRDMSLILSIGKESQVLDHMTTYSLDDVYYNFKITKDKPCLHVKVKLPDLRRRLYLRNRLNWTENELKKKLDDAEKNVFSKDVDKAERALNEAVKSFVDRMKKFDTSCKHLKSDEKFVMKRIRKTFEEIQKELDGQITSDGKSPDEKISILRGHAKTLSKLTQESDMSFPSIFIYLVNEGRLVSTCKVHPRLVVYSEVPEERGAECGKFNSIFFTEYKEISKRKITGDTLGGRIDAYLWFGLASQQDKCLQMLPVEEGMIQDMLRDEELPTEIRHRSGVVFQTRAHLYNAIIDLGHDKSGMSDPYVKVIAGSKSAISHTVKATVTPLWKETVVLPSIVRYRTKSRIQKNQPTIVLELWDNDTYKTSKSGEILARLPRRHTNELIGRVPVKPNVILRQGENGVTKLRTYPVHNGHVQVGEITAAVELVEVSEDNEEVGDLHKIDEKDSDVNETDDEKTDKIPLDTENTNIYKIPETLLPPVQAFIMEVLFWGLRDVKKIRAPSIAIKCGDAKLNSVVIKDYKKGQNFGKISGMVQVNLTKYKTPLVIKLYYKKRNGFIYRGICVHDNINDLFKDFIEETTWKENLNKRNILLHEKALGEAKSSHHYPSEVKINMDVQMVEMERATRKTRGKRKYTTKCKKCLKQCGQKALKAGQYIRTWPKLSERKKRFSFYSLPYLLMSLMQALAWALRKLLFIAMACVCGYERSVRMRSNYYKMIEIEPESTSKDYLYDTINISDVEVAEEEEEEEPDWWTMYYNSIYTSGVAEKIKEIQREHDEQRTIRLCKCCTFAPKVFQNRKANKMEERQKEEPQIVMKHPPELIIYRNELEKVPEFERFSDVLRTFDFYYGKLFSDNKNTLEELKVGSFKGNVLFYPAENGHLVTTSGKPLSQGALTGTVDNEQVNVTIRVYIVRAYGLHPKDKDGKCDPYIILKTGSTEINDRENSVTNQINPYFGRHFEIQGSFPQDHTLTLEIADKDALSKDDFIGKTTIDLESRFYSNHRGSCGLARRYTPEWRDQLRPSQLLEELCDRHEIGYPCYFPSTVVVGAKEFSLPGGGDVEDAREELALLALHNWHQVPLVGTHLVPQHIESRTLYSAESQGVSQGVLEMWVDLFSTDYGWVPSPVNIALRTPTDYELRVIVWNTADVELMDDAYFTGEKHSDIFVKGWLQGREDIQQTDIHYRSAQGEGFFNWRFLFQVRYFAAEALMVVTRKDEEYRVPPKLHLQVWDNDNFSPDDYIGTLVLDLGRMPRGARTAARCTAAIINEATPTINLFQTRRCRGWWPFTVGGNGPDKNKVVGKLEAELQILTREEATTNPAGPGRKEPEALPVPVRPDRFDLNFLWTPYRVVLALVKAHPGKFLLGGLILAAVLFGALFIYAFPGYVAKGLLFGLF